jgi:hypothetical protein
MIVASLNPCMIEPVDDNVNSAKMNLTCYLAGCPGGGWFVF